MGKKEVKILDKQVLKRERMQKWIDANRRANRAKSGRNLSGLASRSIRAAENFRPVTQEELAEREKARWIEVPDSYRFVR